MLSDARRGLKVSKGKLAPVDLLPPRSCAARGGQAQRRSPVGSSIFAARHWRYHLDVNDPDFLRIQGVSARALESVSESRAAFHVRHLGSRLAADWRADQRMRRLLCCRGGGAGRHRASPLNARPWTI